MAVSKAQQLRAIYAQVPRIECKRLCHESCGPISYSREERRIIVRTVGRAPKPDATLTCSLLKEDLCSAYAVRPLICRLWGVVERMRCPHGCVPERWLSDEEAFALMQEALRIGGKDAQAVKDVMRALTTYEHQVQVAAAVNP